jgi:D-alanyl-D-alanine-carboxypeptidase/D-alanyl-D-alanine-endopeptidase
MPTTSSPPLPLSRRLRLAVPAAVIIAAGFTGAAQARVPQSDWSASPDQRMRQLSQIVHQRVDSRRSTGIVAGMVFPDGHASVVAYGDAGHGRHLDASSVFEIGSVTKTFTATLLADMAQRGEVTLSDPVTSLLPAGVSVPSRNGRQITLENLAMHRSGLPRDAGNLEPEDARNPYAGYSVKQLYDYIGGYHLKRDPGARYEYSNIGVGLLGNALASRAHTSYEDLVRERILHPLGMTSTTIRATPNSVGHVASGHDYAGRITPRTDLPAIAGAGALRSSITDMLKFAAANLRPDGGPLQQAMAAARAPRATTDLETERIGLNWIIDRPAGREIIWHNGQTNGFTSFIGLDEARQTAIVVLSNARREGVEDIGFHLLDRRAPLAPAPKQRTAIRLTPNALRRYVGVYDLPGANMTITRTPDGLRASIPGQPTFRLYPESTTRFFVKVEDARLVFELNRSGHVTAVAIHQAGHMLRARKIR